MKNSDEEIVQSSKVQLRISTARQASLDGDLSLSKTFEDYYSDKTKFIVKRGLCKQPTQQFHPISQHCSKILRWSILYVLVTYLSQ